MNKALDARDGVAPSLLTNGPMMDAMKTVDSEPLWSILDQKGTQTMMQPGAGRSGSVTDFESVRKRLHASWYGMDFQHGVKFDLTISTGDSFAAATISSLLTAAVMLRKMSGSDAEKQALTATSIGSDSGRLSDPLRHHRLGLRQPAALAALPEHGALTQLYWLWFNSRAVQQGHLPHPRRVPRGLRGRDAHRQPRNAGISGPGLNRDETRPCRLAAAQSPACLPAVR